MADLIPTAPMKCRACGRLTMGGSPDDAMPSAVCMEEGGFPCVIAQLRSCREERATLTASLAAATERAEKAEGYLTDELESRARDANPVTADTAPMVRAAAEALNRAGYDTSRSRTQVRVYAAGEAPFPETEPDFIHRGRP